MARKKPSKPVSKKASKDKEEAQGKPQMNPELEGFEISINEFGQISSTYDLDKVYEFLNRNVEDKKLKNQKNSKDDVEDDADEDKKKDKKTHPQQARVKKARGKKRK